MENLYFCLGHGLNGHFIALISCQNLRLIIMKNLDFGRGHGQNFDHLTMVISKFWPWSKIFDLMTMTPTVRPNGQKSWSPVV